MLQLGKIGTRVQMLKESGSVHAEQLFFKSLTERKLTWSDGRKSVLITPYVLIMPGKITGMLSTVPSAQRVPDELCLGIVSKHRVVEVIFQNSRDRDLWRHGLQSLVSGQCSRDDHVMMSPSSTASSRYFLDQELMDAANQTANHIISWHEIDDAERERLQRFYPFLATSYSGAMFHQFATLKVPRRILVIVDGQTVRGIDEDNQLVLEMPLDADIVIEDRAKDVKSKGDAEMKRTESASASASEVRRLRLQPFRSAPSSMFCFSIVRSEQRLDIGCHDSEQYERWRDGLRFLCDPQMHSLRLRARSAMLAGDLEIGPSDQRKPQQTEERGKKSKRRRGSLWGSLFG